MKFFRKETYGTSTTYYYVGQKEIAKKIDDCLYIGDWYVGWHSWIFNIIYEECGYDEGNTELNLSLFGWHSKFKFPWKSKRYPQGDCDSPRWGIAVHNEAFWIYTGGNGNMDGGSTFKSFYLPFTYTVPSCRHQVECDLHLFGSKITAIAMVDYETMECKDNVHWKPIHKMGSVYVDGNEYTLRTYKYNYVDSYDGEVIPCVFWIEEREWRLKWLGWTGLFKKVRRTINIEFSKEVGKEKGTWKGGCIGCSYELLPDETPEECIRRMERERKF